MDASLEITANQKVIIQFMLAMMIAGMMIVLFSIIGKSLVK